MATDTADDRSFAFQIGVFRDEPERWVSLLLGVGVVLIGLLGIEFVLIVTGTRAPDGFVSGVVTGVVLLGGYIYGTVWLGRSSLSPERYRRIAGWTLSSAALFVVLITGINAFVQQVTPFLVLTTGRWAATLGAVLGLLAGTKAAQAIENEVEKERAVVRAEELEKRQELLEFLNELLRHEVLNTATAIDNYVELLEREATLEEGTAAYLERIERQSASMSAVITDVRTLVQMLDQSAEPTPTNLTEIVTAEVQTVRERYPDARIACDCPEDVFVAAGEPVSRAVANLLENAVYHNDSERPGVEAAVTVTDELVEVEIADDGPGIPEDKRDSLFEPSSSMGAEHGLGLYLARTIVEQYGGTLVLRESSSAGSVFVVRLPRGSRSDDG